MPTLHPIDLAIIVVYGLIVVVAGVMLSRRAAANMDNYFLGGRNIPWYLLGISNASGMFDITGTMWAVMLLFIYGPKSLWIPWVWPTFNQIFMMIFLAAWLRRSGVLTGAEWLRTRFGEGRGLALAHISVVIFALVAVVAFIAMAFVGVGKFAAVMLPWGFEPETYALSIMSITAIYVVLGGMYSVVLTDVLQFALLTIASVMVGVIAMNQTTTAGIAAATPENWGNLWFGWKLELDWTTLLPQVMDSIREDGYEFFTPFLLMAFCKGILASTAGPTPGYDMQRVLATRDERSALLMSGVVSPVLALPRYLLITGIGVLALSYFSDELAAQSDPDFESLLPQVLQTFIPVGLSGILLAGLLAAFMSTFDSTVNSGAAYLVNDVYKRYINPKASQQTLIKYSYAASLVIVAAGIFVGFYPSSINAQTQWIVGGLYGGYVAPNVLKWVWWRLNGAGYFAGMVTGVILSLAMTQYTEDLLAHIEKLSPGLHEVVHTGPVLYFFPLLLVCSGVASIVVSLFTKPDEEAVLKDFYRNVRPWGFWRPVVNMLQAEDPSFTPNREFTRDMVNCLVGIAWQLSLTAAPVFLVLRDFPALGYTCLVLGATTCFLKINWYNHLPAPKS